MCLGSPSKYMYGIAFLLLLSVLGVVEVVLNVLLGGLTRNKLDSISVGKKGV
ncbi:hypothetical protein NEIELOOT_01707 [Neisseria elongata subsp. glycolytica ATCC 29315]|uniref:Uncharacterized protein n=1 Tax=Neisseria elongata subsp. glycolytica ATCC 29315 TaxID=546263 RepID=D4DRL4_NEIEG|nr:hypothetical protein NEIELOOT_01707 [Neisseria elongata subsp. glycolytica ATCC 29315]